MSIHPDLVDIDFSLPAGKSLSVLCKENNFSGLPKINYDTLNVPQQVNLSAREQCLSPHIIDVPVCNDLVDLSYEVKKETSKEPSVVVLNSDLKCLSYPVPETSVHAVNSITFELCNNCPFVQGQVSGIPTSLLCDTGASVTTIR